MIVTLGTICALQSQFDVRHTENVQSRRTWSEVWLITKSSIIFMPRECVSVISLSMSWTVPYGLYTSS
jgi:hypothetical protein